MCGIVAKIKRTDDEVQTSQQIMRMFDRQKMRGERGIGFISFDEELTGYIRRQTVPEIKAIIEGNTSKSIIFHHRTPTSTPNYADCAHPIRVSHKELKHDYYLVHNGMISNDEILHDEHIELGYEYITTVEKTIKTQNHKFSEYEFNDSEALAIDVARFIEAKQSEIKSSGSIAFICAQVNKKTQKVLRVFFGRNSSPLDIDFTDNELTLRSENGTESIKPNMMYCLDIDTWEINAEEVQIGTLMSSRNYDWQNNHYHDNMYYLPTDPDHNDAISRFMRKGIETVELDNDGISVDELPQLTLWQQEQSNKIDRQIEDLELEQDQLKSDYDYYIESGAYKDVDLEHITSRIKKIADDIDKLDEEKDLIYEGIFGV